MPEAVPRSWEINGRRGRPCITLLAVFLSLIAQGCAGTDELTRARAAELIGGSRAFSAPVSLPLKKETGWNLRPSASDESEAEAQARAAENYYQAYPQMYALRRLGLMDVRATVRESPGENHGVWAFDVEPFLTEKGKELMADGREDQGPPSVILARRELAEVTGITRAGQTSQADYTWKEVPTAAGRAFVPGSPEHESLPPYLWQSLRDRNQTKDLDEVRRGRAVFQLYDDGWRLLSAQ
jgi:hypothetical protein